MLQDEINIHKSLNKIAESNGIVIFGGGEDKDIPIGELRQAFAIESKLYNRSITGLSAENAVELFDECVAPLAPDTILLHVGVADLGAFRQLPSAFDNAYRTLISHIKAFNKNCRIAIVSLKNYNDDAVIAELNKHLKYIADSEQCEFGDIAKKKVWNPQQTKELSSFLCSMGFARPLNSRHSLYDLIKIVFCFDADSEK